MIYAGFWRRVAAHLIDFVVFVPLYVVFFVAYSHSKEATISALIVFEVAALAYPIYFVGRWGKTIGKSVAGIKVLALDGTRATWTQASIRLCVDVFPSIASFLRSLVAYSRMPAVTFAALSWRERSKQFRQLEPHSLYFFRWSIFAWVLAEAIVLVSNRKKRALHDFIAGTVVVVEKPLGTNAF